MLTPALAARELRMLILLCQAPQYNTPDRKNVIKHQMYDLQETLMVLVSTWFFSCLMYSFPGSVLQWI